MRIAFCAYDRPNHIATGPNVWLKRLVPDLLKKGLYVHTIFLHYGEKSECPTISYFKKNKLPLCTKSVEEAKYTEIQIRWLLKQIREIQPDVIVANLVVPAFFVKRYIKNIPVVGVLHSNDPFYYDMLHNFYSPTSIIQLDALVAVSDFLKENALKLNPHLNVVKIPCGTPLISKTASYTGGTLRIMYVGRIVEEQKQILKLTQSFCSLAKQMNEIEFSIYGDGPDVENVLSIIHENNVKNKVKYYGAIPAEEIQLAMLTHHVFTLMSDYEGLPVALTEAMACGLVPVCLSEESGINEVIHHLENGIIVTDRDQCYFDAIKILKNNPLLWQQFSTAAKNTIEKEYATDINHNIWVELIAKQQNSLKKLISTPFRIKIVDIPIMYYGDHRKPPLKNHLKERVKMGWHNFRMFSRPRARIRNLIKFLNEA